MLMNPGLYHPYQLLKQNSKTTESLNQSEAENMKIRTFLNSKLLLVPVIAVSITAKAQEPNSVAIYYNPLFGNPSGNVKCTTCGLLEKDLTAVPGLKVFERQRIDVILQETTLGSSGLVTPETKAEGGKIMKAATIIQLSGANISDGDVSADASLNALMIDSKSGKILSVLTAAFDETGSFSKQIASLSNSGFASPVAVQKAVAPRRLTSVEVDIPVEYDFRYHGVFTDEEGKQEVRQSDQYVLYADGSKKQDKENKLYISSLRLLSGNFSNENFFATFESGIFTDEYISIEGKFNKDKSRIENIKFSRLSCDSYDYGDNNLGYTKHDDMVWAENLVYNSVLKGYEYKNGVSNISKIKSTIDQYESGSVPERTINISHRYKNIDGSRLDYDKKPLGPRVWLYSSEAVARKPVKKIYLRGNWKAYGFVAGLLARQYPDAVLYDQTDIFKAITGNESKISETPPLVSNWNSPAKPAVDEAIVTFTTSGGNDISAEVVTARQTGMVTTKNPELDFSGYAKPPEGEQQVVDPRVDLVRFYQLRWNILGSSIIKEIEK